MNTATTEIVTPHFYQEAFRNLKSRNRQIGSVLRDPKTDSFFYTTTEALPKKAFFPLIPISIGFVDNANKAPYIVPGANESFRTLEVIA